MFNNTKIKFTKCKHNRLQSMQATELFRAATLIIFLAASSAAVADEYYWYVPGGAPGIFLTPEAACSASMADNITRAPSNTKIEFWYFTKKPYDIVYPYRYEYNCAFKHYSLSADKTTWNWGGVGGWSIIRGGTECPTGYISNDESFLCEDSAASRPSKQIGAPSTKICTSGNPEKVSLAIIGNNYRTEEDLAPKDASAISFLRYYNSTTGLWGHTYSTHLTINLNGSSATLVAADGKRNSFTLSGGGSYRGTRSARFSFARRLTMDLYGI